MKAIKYETNLILGCLAVVSLVHSIVRFGTGALPEAILAMLLFLKAFSDRKQPWSVAALGSVAVATTWAANAYGATTEPFKQPLLWIGVALFAMLAFSRYIFERNHAPH